MFRWLFRWLFRLQCDGLENLSGRLVAANRCSRWDWVIVTAFLEKGSWIILPPGEFPLGY
ncbi:MAG TPA: hypothetical protein HPQ00_07295, partial [Magnetococcales bacterium]|nr:hypothetical protein [Magnetococcales bacterium]